MSEKSRVMLLADLSVMSLGGCADMSDATNGRRRAAILDDDQSGQTVVCSPAASVSRWVEKLDNHSGVGKTVVVAIRYGDGVNI